ncbi:SpoVG family protein [Mariniblastus sp.]|nr:SpoVG family protein [Mariniblastus sp.]
MKITEVRIKLMDGGEDRLRGFCSVTFDDAFVVRDLKIIEGNNGPFVAMPSRKLTFTCPKCHTKNHLRSNYCNNCGKRQPTDQVSHDAGGRAKLYADIAHPVNAECREMIQSRVIAELEKELARANEPGYFSRYDDGYSASRAPAKTNHHPKTVNTETVDKVGAATEPKVASEADANTDSNRTPAEVTRADSAQANGQDGPHPSVDSTVDSVKQSDTRPDNPNISSGRSKPAAEEFGEGIFD